MWQHPRVGLWTWIQWCGGVVVVTNAQLHSPKSELIFCAGSNPACSLSKICEGENLWERSRLEIICKHLSSINHPTKRIPHHQHHHRHHHHHHRQTYDVRWTGGQEIEFLTSMQEKRKLFYLIACITLMLLVRKWVGLSLIKNRLLRCWGCLFLLNWIGTLAISMPGLLILIASWICWMSYRNGCI